MMEEQNITKVTSHAIDSGGHAEAAKKKRGRQQKDGSKNDKEECETAAILKTFVFGVGARVMLRRNIFCQRRTCEWHSEQIFFAR